MSDSARERAAAKITRLASQPGDLVTFWRSCTEVIAGVVPYYWTPCWFTLDPASLLITSHFHEGMPRIPAEWLAEEYYGDDVNKLADFALPTSASARCMRQPAATRPAAPAGSATCSWGVTRS